MAAIPYNGTLEVDTVTRTLGANSYDVGTLCKWPTVNMWSRMKPVRIAKYFPDYDPTKRWWRSDNNNCGIDYSKARASTVNEVLELYTSDKSNGYIYQRPYGGDDAPYRLLDFAGYYPEAKPPVFSFVVTGEVDNQQGSKFKASVGMNAEDHDKTAPGSLSLSEIGMTISGQPTSLGELYFGVAVRQGGRLIKYGTANKKGFMEVAMSSYDLPQGDYEVVPFLCNLPLDGVSQKVGVFLTLPNVAPASMKVVEKSVHINPYAKWNYNTTGERMSVSWNIEVSQTLSAALTLNNNTCRLRFVNSSWGAPMMVGEEEYKIDNFVVGHGEVVNPIKLGMAFFTGPFKDGQEYKLQISLGGGSYRIETNIMDKVSPQA